MPPATHAGGTPGWSFARDELGRVRVQRVAPRNRARPADFPLQRPVTVFLELFVLAAVCYVAFVMRAELRRWLRRREIRRAWRRPPTRSAPRPPSRTPRPPSATPAGHA